MNIRCHFCLEILVVHCHVLSEFIVKHKCKQTLGFCSKGFL